MKIRMQDPKDWTASSRIPLLAVRTGSEVPEMGMMVVWVVRRPWQGQASWARG